jgi:hypothetical protein
MNIAKHAAQRSRFADHEVVIALWTIWTVGHVLIVIPADVPSAMHKTVVRSNSQTGQALRRVRLAKCLREWH